MKEARINESRLKIATDSSKESVSKKDFPRIFRRRSANQAMEDAANMPIPNMLFGEFIFEEELTVLYTKPNVGKSLLAMHITEMIATGTGLEGLKNESEPQKVIYVDLELSDQQRRIRYSEEIINPKTGKREYYNAYNFHKNVIIVDYNYEEIPKRYDRLEVIFKNIEAEFEETGAKVMVIDNISWLTMKGLERSDHAKELMSKLANLVKNKKYGMLVVAHTPKISENTPIELGDLSEESKRAERENLEEEELTVFDMLLKDKKISDKEKAQVKEAAKELLKRLKKKEFKVQHWTEKIQTASAVKKEIEDYLFEKLPSPSYDEDIQIKSEILFNDFKERYADFGIKAA